VGLIARCIEAAGVPTVSMTSAWDVTAAVRPPRSLYVHHPLGHQTGRPGDLAGQVTIVRAALGAAPTLARGEIRALPFRWDLPGSEGWEARAYTSEEAPTGPDGKPVRG
jgi:D-proline reductase (dithiol) PrdB